MGWNFRKSVRVGKGVRINLSKSGIGVSAGVKGLRVGANKRGLYTSQSIPGTGLYKREYITKSAKKTAKDPLPAAVGNTTETLPQVTPNEPAVKNEPKKKRGKGCLSVLAIFLILGFIGSLTGGVSADQAEVLSVLAADQVAVRYTNGSDATIKLAGIDWPPEEDTAVAIGYIRTALVGQTVYVQKMKTDQDAAFIWTVKPDKADDAEIRESMFNAELLLKGHAEYSPAEVDSKYRDSLKSCETEARQAQVGMWMPLAALPEIIAEAPAPETNTETEPVTKQEAKPASEPIVKPVLKEGPKQEPAKSSEAKEPVQEPVKNTPAQAPTPSTPKQESTPTPVASTPKAEQPKVEPEEVIVYISDTGTRYHRSTCQHVKKSKTAINLDDALAGGYVACKVCRAPQR